MNKIEIVGRIVREADLQTKGDITLAKTTIASNRSRKGAKHDFLDIVAFGDAAGQLAELSKGEFVRVHGTIRTGSYDAQDGSRRKSATVVVRKVERYTQEAAA